MRVLYVCVCVCVCDKQLLTSIALGFRFVPPFLLPFCVQKVSDMKTPRHSTDSQCVCAHSLPSHTHSTLYTLHCTLHTPPAPLLRSHSAPPPPRLPHSRSSASHDRRRSARSSPPTTSLHGKQTTTAAAPNAHGQSQAPRSAQLPEVDADASGSRSSRLSTASAPAVPAMHDANASGMSGASATTSSTPTTPGHQHHHRASSSATAPASVSSTGHTARSGTRLASSHSSVSALGSLLADGGSVRSREERSGRRHAKASGTRSRTLDFIGGACLSVCVCVCVSVCLCVSVCVCV